MSLTLCAYYKYTDAADHPPKVGSASFGRYKTDWRCWFVFELLNALSIRALTGAISQCQLHLPLNKNIRSIQNDKIHTHAPIIP